MDEKGDEAEIKLVKIKKDYCL